MSSEPPCQAICRQIYRRIHDALFYKPRTRRVSCTLTDEEARLLDRKSQAQGMKPTPAFKAFALAQMHAAPLLTKSQEEALLQLVNDLKAIGRNVNQVVHHYHATQGRSSLQGLDGLVRAACGDVDRFLRSPQPLPAASPASSPASPPPSLPPRAQTPPRPPTPSAVPGPGAPQSGASGSAALSSALPSAEAGNAAPVTADPAPAAPLRSSGQDTPAPARSV